MKTIVRSMALTALAFLAGPWVLAGMDEDLYNTGRNAVFEERWGDARGIFEDLTRRYPDSSFADDAQYWLGMALYEQGDPEKAYGVLKDLSIRFAASPWSDDARVLMVRCAESALKKAATRAQKSSSPGSRLPAQRTSSEYQAFIERSTRDSNAKVQLLAIDTMLLSNPGRAPELLPRLNDGKTSREATGLVLDRFFGGEKVKVTLENPALGLRDGNVAIMIRENDQVSYLSLTEATELMSPPAGRVQGGRFSAAIISEIREKVLQAERNLVREGDAGTVQTLPGLGSKSMSAIVKVVDGEIHYYKSGDETVRILVLKREAGFSEDNIRIFVETGSKVEELGLATARKLSQGAAEKTGGLSDATVRYLKAALAIIEIDLGRSAGAK